MNISELGPGLYKVRIHEAPRLIKRSRNLPSPTAHLLQIKGYGEKRTYQLDGDSPATRERLLVDEDELEIVGKITQPVLNRASIHLTWKDEDGDDFAVTTLDTWGVKDLFEQYPFLVRAFNYRPRKNNELN